MAKKWTTEEKQFLFENWGKMEIKELAEKFEVPERIIKTQYYDIRKKNAAKRESELINKEIAKTTNKADLLGDALDIVKEKEEEIEKLNKEITEFKLANNKQGDTIDKLHEDIEAHKGDKKYICELKTALQYREKVIEDLKSQLAEMNPYHATEGNSVPRECFEKLEKAYGKLQVKMCSVGAERDEAQDRACELEDRLRDMKLLFRIIEGQEDKIDRLRTNDFIKSIGGKN
jgi:chromosome segregation ATPase